MRICWPKDLKLSQTPDTEVVFTHRHCKPKEAYEKTLPALCALPKPGWKVQHKPLGHLQPFSCCHGTYGCQQFRTFSVLHPKQKGYPRPQLHFTEDILPANTEKKRKANLKLKVIREAHCNTESILSKSCSVEDSCGQQKSKQKFKWLIFFFLFGLIGTAFSWKDADFMLWPLILKGKSWQSRWKLRLVAELCTFYSSCKKGDKNSGTHVNGVQGGKREKESSSSLIFCASHPHIASRRQNLQASTQQIYILIPHPDLNLRSKQLKINHAFVVQTKLPHRESSKICTSLWSLSGISQWEKMLCTARHMHVT